MTATDAPTEHDLLETTRLLPAQRRFLKYFASTGFRRRFFLTGGAGLAAGYLAHRNSDDLDFFSPEKVPIKRLLSFMRQLPGLKDLQWLLPRDRTTFMITWDDASQVKVEYRQFPFPHVDPPRPIGPFYVDSLRDLLANKLYALIERRYELDRIDIYLMLERIGTLSLDEGIALAEQKFSLEGQIRESVLARLQSPIPDAPPSVLFNPIDLDAMADTFRAL